MQIIEKKIEELIPYENNPRQNEDSVKLVANSIKQFGFKVPIIIDKNNIIVAGHTRLLASKKLGIEKVPCIIADDLNEEQIKAFRLADNKVSELSYWDYDVLDEEISRIYDIDMSGFGFNIEFNSDNFIDDLLENGFIGKKAEQKEFGITFQFPMEKKEFIENYIKENGKEKIVYEILKKIGCD